MDISVWQTLLGWSALINYGLLLLWVLLFALARDWMYRFHGQWFDISDQHFDIIHYFLMGWFKLLIFVFNLTPYLVLRFLV
jgi:hypothetical protein